MRRHAWLLQVREGKEQEYLDAHAAVWPELISASRKAGLRNQTCFLSGRTVIVYLEADDPDAALKSLAATDVKRRWDQAMSTILESSEPPVFEDIFHFD
jgi:L-rhamnose mutarotase